MSLNSSSALTPIFLVGATATGKSDLGLALARRTDGAILAMDAMQVYRGANIGTGKPSAAERAEIPHGGLDLSDFGLSFDVAQYRKHAAEFLREQAAANRRVIVVGGTGLYFRALTRGLCDAPQGPDELRAELAKLTPEQLRERLKRADPAMLERLDASNPRRLARAIEVVETTGRSLREWQEKTPEPLVPHFTAFWIQREKEELEKRIEARVERMFASGWVEEVMELRRRHSLEAVRRFSGIGYREIGESLIMRAEGDYRVPPWLKRDIFVATRQYAKRQLTWFNREPNLRRVMLHGAELPSLDAPYLS
ncbi:MAG TPA: tRNA (adenosine(37)-N6)-dimethylallyltransferase MiaA [Candidatus Methylacidiphilales bacterium]|nr:tRNA (adenosine(37)-N6)-dimethylallyltransferase MiaA [Candidatus Methylacidiphilales bacterium]